APFLVARALTHRNLVIEAYPLAVSRRELQSPVEGFRHGTSLHEVGISSAVRAALLSAWPLAERFLGATKDSPVP
ncbi:MAG: hypothetical protein ACO3JL_19120, partial [Myxococcota bacterium]